MLEGIEKVVLLAGRYVRILQLLGAVAYVDDVYVE